MVKQWWGSLPRGRRNLVVVMIVIFTLVILAALFGWIRSLTTDDRADTSSLVGAKPTTGTTKGEVESDKGEGTVTQDGFVFDVDDNGMAIMPVTTDPREAAAGAAAVAFSVDFSKLSREEFLEAAISRMTHPSENYIGPEGQIHTLVESRPFEETQHHYFAPEEVLQLQMDSWSLRDNPENFSWWTLANGATYNNFTLLPDHFWRAQPKTIVSEDEMREIEPLLLPSFPAGTDMEPDTTGATLSQWWVLSDVENSKVGTAQATTLLPAHFAIWCDAPDDGGLCGVAYTLESSFPAVWPRQ